MLLTVPIEAVSLAVRFRRARGLERQQLRWLAFAAGLASVGAVLVLAGTSGSRPWRRLPWAKELLDAGAIDQSELERLKAKALA